MADAHNAVTAPHSAQGPIFSVLSAHLNMATPNFYIHEIFSDFNVSWEEDLIEPAFTVEDGYVTPPDGPGLGIELNLDEISKHPYQRDHWLPIYDEGWEQREGNT